MMKTRLQKTTLPVFPHHEHPLPPAAPGQRGEAAPGSLGTGWELPQGNG